MHSAKHRERAQQFAQVAAHLFAQRGYRGTSTREIACLAGIAENTLFRYFESKENLFWTALEVTLAGCDVRPKVLEELENNPHPEQVMPRLVAQIVNISLVRPELVRLIAVAYLELGPKTAEVCRPPLAPLFGTISRYLAALCAASGRKGLDPALLTSAVVTTALLFGGMEGLLAGLVPTRSTSRETIDAVSGFWTEVLLPGRAGESSAPPELSS